MIAGLWHTAYARTIVDGRRRRSRTDAHRRASIDEPVPRDEPPGGGRSSALSQSSSYAVAPGAAGSVTSAAPADAVEDDERPTRRSPARRRWRRPGGTSARPHGPSQRRRPSARRRRRTTRGRSSRPRAPAGRRRSAAAAGPGGRGAAAQVAGRREQVLLPGLEVPGEPARSRCPGSRGCCCRAGCGRTRRRR